MNWEQIPCDPEFELWNRWSLIYATIEPSDVGHGYQWHVMRFLVLDRTKIEDPTMPFEGRSYSFKRGEEYFSITTSSSGYADTVELSKALVEAWIEATK